MSDDPLDLTPETAPVFLHPPIVRRALGLLKSPVVEWVYIDAESQTSGEILRKYALPLASIPAVALFFALLLAAGSQSGLVVGFAFKIALTSYLMGLAILAGLCVAINMLAPRFGGMSNVEQAVKGGVYAFTPIWVFGILLIVVPERIGLVTAIGFLYAGYVGYAGWPKLMRVPVTRVAGFVASVLVAWITIYFAAKWFLAPLLSAAFT